LDNGQSNESFFSGTTHSYGFLWYAGIPLPLSRQEHHETHKNEDGKPDPDSLLGKLMKARSFDQFRLEKLSALSWLVHVARTTWTKGLERHALGWWLGP
jgi:hypothetical protein